jgi:ATP-dependent DNA ligase
MPTKVSSKASTIQNVRADIDPMLCKTYNPDKFKWTGSWLAEPKFDGLRCIVVIEPVCRVPMARAYSRNGKPLWNMGPILTEALRAAPSHRKFILDGEVYTKDWNLSMSIVKRSTQTHPDQDKLRYHVWDCLTLEEWRARVSEVPNADRKKRLDPWKNGKYVELVDSTIINNEQELQTTYQTFLTQGYEGAILKNPEGIYECGRRSPNWLKIKPWSDADLTVVRSYSGEGKHLGRVGGLVLEGEVEWNGRTYCVKTEVGTGFTDEEREAFQKMEDTQTLAGRIVEIKFQSIAEDTGACRFPVYSRLREDKE